MPFLLAVLLIIDNYYAMTQSVRYFTWETCDLKFFFERGVLNLVLIEEYSTNKSPYEILLVIGALIAAENPVLKKPSGFSSYHQSIENDSKYMYFV